MSDQDWSKLFENTLLTLLQAGNEGLLVFDASDTCRLVGRRAGEFFALEPSQLVGRSRAEVLAQLSAACEEPEAFLSMANQPEDKEGAQTLGQVEVRNPRRVLTWTSAPIGQEAGAPMGRLIMLHDVTREASAERARRHLLMRIEQLTPLDALTGLANRKRFIEEHEREHGRAMRAWDSYAIVRLDIDQMAQLNASYGLPVGDTVLERMAEMLRLGRREYDLVARWENDEFAILLPGADELAARSVAERIAGTLATATDQTETPAFTASMGVAVCTPPTGESASDVMRRCGEALDAARARGTSQVEFDTLHASQSAPRL